MNVITKDVTSKTFPISNLTPNTEDISTSSSRKRKQYKISRCQNKTIKICNECKKSVCGTCTNKVIKLSTCKDCKKE